MAEFKWNQSFSVGDEAIDEDHQGLFALVSELQNADISDGFLADIIGRLEDYAAGHFAREETHMREMNFPGYDDHVREHEAFVEWIDTVKATYRRAPESVYHVSDSVNSFLQKWLTRHIMKEDMKYRDFAAGDK